MISAFLLSIYYPSPSPPTLSTCNLRLLLRLPVFFSASLLRHSLFLSLTLPKSLFYPSASALTFAIYCLPLLLLYLSLLFYRFLYSLHRPLFSSSPFSLSHCFLSPFFLSSSLSISLPFFSPYRSPLSLSSALSPLLFTPSFPIVLSLSLYHIF